MIHYHTTQISEKKTLKQNKSNAKIDYLNPIRSVFQFQQDNS